MSDNKRSWWDNANATRLGYQPQDRSEDWAKEILADGARDTDDDAAETYQGGTFVSLEDGGGRVPDLCWFARVRLSMRPILLVSCCGLKASGL